MQTAKDKIVYAGPSEPEKLRRLDETEGTLRPKLEPAITRWRTAAAELEGLLGDERKSLEETREQLAAMQGRLEERAEEIDTLTDLLRGHDDPSKNFAKPDASVVNSEALRKLDISTRELATLSKFLRTAEENAHWLREVNNVLLLQSPSWWRFMPLRWQEGKRDARLRRKGLFDAEAYLKRYPDVAQAGMNPLRHYILHGQAEGRLR